jgi:C4-dicarboxylate transporter, DctM subunit
MALHFDIHPVHLGIIFLANLELGYLTPPVGMNLFLALYRLNKPLLEVYRSVVSLLAIMLVGVLVITFVPPLSTTLPGMFREKEAIRFPATSLWARMF